MDKDKLNHLESCYTECCDDTHQEETHTPHRAITVELYLGETILKNGVALSTQRTFQASRIPAGFEFIDTFFDRH